MNLEQTIEALLFATGESFKIEDLSKLLNRDTDEIEESLTDLELSLQERGIQLIRSGNEVALVSRKEISPLLEALKQAELSGPLSQAAIDTLTIVLYCSPIDKSKVDHIRGVDSRTMLRTLRSRDLIKEERDKSQIVYNPTMKLLRFMGISSPTELPDFGDYRKKLLAFVSEND